MFIDFRAEAVKTGHSYGERDESWHGADNHTDLSFTPVPAFATGQAVRARAPRFGMRPGFALDGESSIGGCGNGWFAAALRRLEGMTGLGIVELVEDNDMERRREVP